MASRFRSRTSLTLAALVLFITLSSWAGSRDPVIAPPTIRLEGRPAEMGAAHGKAMRDEIATLLAKFLRPMLAVLGTDRAAMISRSREMEPFIPERFRLEMRAIAEAASLEYDDVLLANTFLDLKEIARCSTLAARGKATRDGRVLLGRNLDFPSLGFLEKYTRLLVYRPSGNGLRAFASVGWPALTGVLSGMNRDGLAVAVMEVYDGDSTARGTPYTFLFRQILEECGSTTEAIALLRRSRITTSNNLMLADRHGRIAVAEMGPSEIFVREPEDDAVFSCNHFQRDVEQVLPFHQRYRALRRFAESRHGAIDLDSLEAALAEVAQPLLTIQSMVFMPETLELHLAWTSVPATGAPYVPIRLEPLLR